MNEVPLKKIVAENLTHLRKEKGLTQIQLAQQFNYSDKAVSKWERGDTLPDLETLKALADFYGVTLDYLVYDGPNKKQFTKPKATINFYAISLISCTIAPLICIIVYLCLYLSIGYNYWLLFFWCIPVDSLLLFIFSWIWFSKKSRSIFGIIFCFSSLVLTYIELGMRLENGVGWNTWEILLLVIPLTIALILWTRIKNDED